MKDTPRQSLRHAIARASEIDDLGDAVLEVMDALGVTAGDEASVFFSGPGDDQDEWKRLDRDRRECKMINYARAELTGLMRYTDREASHANG